MSYFLITYRPPRKSFPGDATEPETAIIGEHFEFLKQLLAERRLIIAGRREDAELGIVVIDVDSEATARSILESDPAISGGVFSGEVAPFRLALMADRVALDGK